MEIKSKPPTWLFCRTVSDNTSTTTSILLRFGSLMYDYDVCTRHIYEIPPTTTL